MPAHGLQVMADSGRFQRLSQPPDVHIDSSLLQVRVGAPNVIEQLGPAVRAPGVTHEKFQQSILCRTQVYFVLHVGHAV